MLEQKTYKNYKELCGIMDWKTTGGTYKKARIKDLECLCKYHKSGNTIIIDEIYDKPLPKEDNKRNTIYKENVDKLLLHMCSETFDSKYKHIELSINGLMQKLNIVNKNFSVGRNNIDKFSRWSEIPVETLYDFFNSTYKKNKDIVESGLNRLKNKCLIDWYKTTNVCTLDGDFRKATDGELEGIKEIEQQVLKDLGLESKQEVFLKGKWNLFQKNKTKMLREMMKLQYNYSAYRIITTKTFRKMLLEKQDKETIEWELNYDVQSSSIKGAENRKNKTISKYTTEYLIGGNVFTEPYYEKDKNRISDDYVDDTKRAARICIDNIDPINLWEALSDVSDSKFTYKESISKKFWGDMPTCTDFDDLFDLL